jgi:hypothetical protein
MSFRVVKHLVYLACFARGTLLEGWRIDLAYPVLYGDTHCYFSHTLRYFEQQCPHSRSGVLQTAEIPLWLDVAWPL